MDPEQADKALDSGVPLPLIEPGHTYATVTDKISAIVLTRPTPKFWYIGFGLSFIFVLILLYAAEKSSKLYGKDGRDRVDGRCGQG